MGVSRIRSLSPRYLGVPSVYLVQFRIYAESVSQTRWYPTSLLHTVAVIDRESAEPRGRRSTIHGFPSPSPILFGVLCPSQRCVLVFLSFAHPLDPFIPSFYSSSSSCVQPPSFDCFIVWSRSIEGASHSQF